MKELSFEKAIETLQSTVKKLEAGELTLEASLQAFQEGVELTRTCQEYLKKAEQRVEVFLKENTEKIT